MFKMKVQDLTVEVLLQYLSLELEPEDVKTYAEVQMYLTSSIAYAKTYTGLDDEELAANEMLSVPILLLAAHMFEHKSMEGTRYANGVFDDFLNINTYWNL